MWPELLLIEVINSLEWKTYLLGSSFIFPSYKNIIKNKTKLQEIIIEILINKYIYYNIIIIFNISHNILYYQVKYKKKS